MTHALSAPHRCFDHTRRCTGAGSRANPDGCDRTHILPRFDKLPETTGALVSAALVDCTPTSPALRAAYDDAFDSWISASHLRFGPTEVDDRAFALAFWPDTKGFTAKALSQHIATEDEAVQSPEAYSETSIAGRGFFALERMLYDPTFADQGSAEYRCDLIQAITTDIDANAQAITEGWQSYAPNLTQPGDNSPYRTQDEALQELFKALSAGLEFTADTRLGRPLGTFDRPRPNRAEARRSERSLRHVELSLMPCATWRRVCPSIIPKSQPTWTPPLPAQSRTPNPLTIPRWPVSLTRRPGFASRPCNNPFGTFAVLPPPNLARHWGSAQVSTRWDGD